MAILNYTTQISVEKTAGEIRGMIINIKKLADKAGVDYIERPNGHVQFIGPLTVNYYPASKNKSAYVAGTKGAVKNVTPKQAIRMCFEAPKRLKPKEKDKRPKNTRRIRRRLIERGIKKCHWCEVPLCLETSTLEHIIPLDRGGLDNDNNRTLACLDCNSGRGNDMPELKRCAKEPANV